MSKEKTTYALYRVVEGGDEQIITVGTVDELDYVTDFDRKKFYQKVKDDKRKPKKRNPNIGTLKLYKVED
jgi:hypothetical protein